MSFVSIKSGCCFGLTKKEKAMKKSLSVVVACLGLALGGCASLNPVGAGTVGGGIVGGVAMHALTGGASTAWQVIGTAAGVGAGAVVGNKVDK
ncbi:MAG: hypothetical protein Q7S34_03890 [bacterium]|nr:hypothetical protein [bacterium]